MNNDEYILFLIRPSLNTNIRTQEVAPKPELQTRLFTGYKIQDTKKYKMQMRTGHSMKV